MDLIASSDIDTGVLLVAMDVDNNYCSVQSPEVRLSQQSLCCGVHKVGIVGLQGTIVAFVAQEAVPSKVPTRR